MSSSTSNNPRTPPRRRIILRVSPPSPTETNLIPSQPVKTEDEDISDVSTPESGEGDEQIADVQDFDEEVFDATYETTIAPFSISSPPSSTDNDKTDVASIHSSSTDSSMFIGEGVCENWRNETFNAAIRLFKWDVSSDWAVTYLRSFHKGQGVCLKDVEIFRAYWERKGRLEDVKLM
jgi:hypothetical protein